MQHNNPPQLRLSDREIMLGGSAAHGVTTVESGREGVSGERVRVTASVYEGGVPSDPGATRADLSTHFWTSVTGDGDA
jgi:hypothetical protein